MPKKKRPTQTDVAKLADVSRATVSYVLNNSDAISVPDETRQRIWSAAEKLGYSPNALARGLASGYSSLVAIIVPSVADFFDEVINGVEYMARKHGYSVIISTTHDSPEQELTNIDVLASRQVDGIIICGSRLEAETLSEISQEHQVSLLTSRSPATAGVVCIPGEAGLCEITTHLIKLGHQAIGHIGWKPAGENERAPGYQRALQENGIALDDRMITFASEITYNAGRHGLEVLLDSAPEITAVTCYNDNLAIGAIQAAKQLGHRVPEDIAIVGFDDIPVASVISPALTTMRVPRFKTGQLLMEVLLRAIDAGSAYEEKQIVPLELVVRESCGAQQVTSN